MSNRRGRQQGNAKGAARRNADNKKVYAFPLPLFLEAPSDIPYPRKCITDCLGLFGYSAQRISKPHLEGILDAPSRSVWISNTKDAMILWRRGFFGKGNLSRSEPSWLARQINQQKSKAIGKMTAEEVREKRRMERKQFKLDRARAIAEAALEAEKAFAATGEVLAESSVVIPSAATWKPSPASDSNPDTELPLQSGTPPTLGEQLTDEQGGDILDEDLKDMEHLQLTLQEAFFLIWTMDCLTIADPSTGSSLNLQQIWRAFQAIYYPSFFVSRSLDAFLSRFDNPFLIHYVVFHHYRSLGWVLKNGIKFCVDYMLYKRGPVFSHADFSLVVCPVYEDPSDREGSPFDLQNVGPFTWSWLSTINRVNSQVQKTPVLTYVTIPAMSRLPSDILSSPACLEHYTIREIVVRRFIPARMRD
ncbi:uncharacterized protein FOMMEDRAFT_130716 [Fomitiporia mediterranea MF3/22]|uniref:uncharacterized protein n=1 Tax=Fomitiporia mediterranea (strain MF3/22) TaxID=694068 RepID=UPI0004408508|nr:uncharacterized protein FOMMEDRAFT_130716 [Fomitiporia mediterranea MF3/22]EJD07559.1 hypothetical protein FOMMEDRAFT_130716 [Fomitiporia mediterranea MF3/22]